MKGLIVAATIATVMLVLLPVQDGIQEALCAGLAKESVEWYLYMCYLL